MSSPPSHHLDFERPPDDAAVSDAVLYSRMQQGDAEALGILYDRHAGLVYGIGLKVLTDQQAAEDLTQDIFVMLADASAYNPRRGALRTYLSILTRSRAIDRLRSRGAAARRVSRLQSQQVLAANKNLPLEEATKDEQAHTLTTALTQLSEKEQQVLHMMYFEGLSQPAISDKLDIPLGTVKTHSRRGLIKLRQILAVTP
ncbi:MAG: sigma-70 family RNA polymerase sigma factor [Phormidesmis sp.]